MQIHGFNKLTLLDYPGHLAATIFLGGCNMRCPFCHNASLVTDPSSQPVIPAEDVLSALSKRQKVLEGVCITGGEPTLYQELPEFIEKIMLWAFG
jgi:pyruvate formate lyase activating enzyme